MVDSYRYNVVTQLSVHDEFSDAMRESPVKGFMKALSIMQGAAVRHHITLTEMTS